MLYISVKFLPSFKIILLILCSNDVTIWLFEVEKDICFNSCYNENVFVTQIMIGVNFF